MKLTKYDKYAFDLENQADLRKVRAKLRTAKPGDFQVVHLEHPDYPYAAAFYGCYDMAIFKRKADCERFIASFAPKDTDAKS